MHRELAHISSKLAAPIELQGRTVRKSAASPAETFGSWEKLLSRTKAYHRVVSPNQVAERTIEAKNANRTINPQLNDEQERKTRKIKSTKGGPEDPGNMLVLLKKSGTIDTALNSRKKAFKGCLQTEQTTTPQYDKRLLTRPHPKKQEEWTSNILTSPTCMGDTEESFFGSPATSPTRFKRQDFLKSSIATLPNDDSTKKAFQDRDEKKILQSAHSPRRIQHLTSTFQDELFQPLSNKKDPNRQNYKSYEEDGRLHPYSKGKKVEYPQYLERNTSTVMSPKANTLVGSPRYGGMEPLNALFDGRRNIASKPVIENIITRPPVHKDSARGGTVFSYRTFASQIF